MGIKIKNSQNIFLNSTEIGCKYLGDLHTEAKHSISGSVINTYAPKDNDGKGEGFASTHLLTFALGTSLITKMAIEAKRRGWELGEISIIVHKTMASKGLRKIKSLFLDIQMLSDIYSHKLKILKIAADNCPLKLNIEKSLDIKFSWKYNQDNILII